MRAAAICSSVSLILRCNAPFVVSFRTAAVPCPGGSPTALRTDCATSGNRLAPATPTASATIKSAPIMPRRPLGLAGRFMLFSRLEVFRNRLEFAHDCTCRLASAIGRGIEALIDVIVDQCFLGLANGLLNSVKLLGNIETRPSFLDHRNNQTQVSLRPL